jgi:hypothetical protein
MNGHQIPGQPVAGIQKHRVKSRTQWNVRHRLWMLNIRIGEAMV